MKMKATILSIGMLGLGMLGGSAMAANEKIYTGSFCQPAFGNNINEWQYDINKGIINEADLFTSGTGARFVTCPILRDNTRNTNGLREVWVTGNRSVAVNSNSGSNEFYCIIRSTNHRGDTIDSEQLHFGLNAGRVAVRFTGINVSHRAAGHYGMFCKIPLNASLIEYEVDEP